MSQGYYPPEPGTLVQIPAVGDFAEQLNIEIVAAGVALDYVTFFGCEVRGTAGQAGYALAWIDDAMSSADQAKILDVFASHAA